jgi:hypothetical protein
MASGTLGQASLTAATNTAVYTAGATPSTFNVSMTNTTGFPISVNLSISATSTPAAGEYIEYQTVIPGNGVLERGGLVATSGKIVVAYATLAGINVNIYGYEG